MMHDSFSDIISALFNSRRFSAFIDGVEVDLPSGESVLVKILKTKRLKKQATFEFYKYSYQTTMKAAGVIETGCGESDNKLLAIEKSVSEALERVLFRVLKGSKFGTANSNGWAAHLNVSKAEKSALFELLERDAVLTHWLTETPFVETDPETFPRWLRDWKKSRLENSAFPILRVLISGSGHVPAVSTALLSEGGNGVISHASGQTLNAALVRALSETCRLAEMAESGRYIKNSLELWTDGNDAYHFTPFEQAVVYAHHQSFPTWVFGKRQSFAEIEKNWKMEVDRFNETSLPYTFHTIMKAPLAVGYCTSPCVQSLFFGKTSNAAAEGKLNFHRLRSNTKTFQLNFAECSKKPSV